MGIEIGEHQFSNAEVGYLNDQIDSSKNAKFKHLKDNEVKFTPKKVDGFVSRIFAALKSFWDRISYTFFTGNFESRLVDRLDKYIENEELTGKTPELKSIIDDYPHSVEKSPSLLSVPSDTTISGSTEHEKVAKESKVIEKVTVRGCVTDRESVTESVRVSDGVLQGGTESVRVSDAKSKDLYLCEPKRKKKYTSEERRNLKSLRACLKAIDFQEKDPEAAKLRASAGKALFSAALGFPTVPPLGSDAGERAQSPSEPQDGRTGASSVLKSYGFTEEEMAMPPPPVEGSTPAKTASPTRPLIEVPLSQVVEKTIQIPAVMPGAANPGKEGVGVVSEHGVG
jgi:hypothetical protein